MTEFVGLARCMDEAINGPGERFNVTGLDVVQYDFGLAGSGIVRMGAGSQEKLPDEYREIFRVNQRHLLRAFKNVSRYLSAAFVVSNHVGCGWAAAQGIVEVADATLTMCQRAGVTYAGEIGYGHFPMQLGHTQAYANMSRHPQEHHHSGRSIVVSVGGAITPGELAQFENQRYGDAFVISADFASEAVTQGWMSSEDVIKILSIQLDLADALANREIDAASVLPYDAGRLNSQARGYNEWIFDQAVASLARK